MNRRLYACYAKWTEFVAQARRVKAKFARALAGRKRYYFMSWQEGMISRIAVRSLKALLAAHKSSGGRGLVGLTKAMNSIVQQIMLEDVSDMTHEDAMMPRAQLHVRDWHKIENAAALRVQSRWRLQRHDCIPACAGWTQREARSRATCRHAAQPRNSWKAGRKATERLRVQRRKKRHKSNTCARRAAEDREHGCENQRRQNSGRCC